MIKIPLTKGKVVIIDDDDFEKIAKFKWRVGDCSRGKNKNSRYYARSQVYLGSVGNKPKVKPIFMHRMILGLKRKGEVDHINGDSLDNRKENLRIVSHQQNCWNSCKKKSANNTSIHKGVGRQKGTKPWRARIVSGGKRIHLGSFATEIEAAKAYDEAAMITFGEYANINFPLGRGAFFVENR